MSNAVSFSNVWGRISGSSEISDGAVLVFAQASVTVPGSTDLCGSSAGGAIGSGGGGGFVVLFSEFVACGVTNPAKATVVTAGSTATKSINSVATMAKGRPIRPFPNKAHPP